MQKTMCYISVVRLQISREFANELITFEKTGVTNEENVVFDLPPGC